MEEGSQEMIPPAQNFSVTLRQVDILVDAYHKGKDEFFTAGHRMKLSEANCIAFYWRNKEYIDAHRPLRNPA